MAKSLSADEADRNLEYVRELASSPAFRWFMGRVLAKRQRCAEDALKRLDTIEQHTHLIGMVGAYDRVMSILEVEAGVAGRVMEEASRGDR